MNWYKIGKNIQKQRWSRFTKEFNSVLSNNDFILKTLGHINNLPLYFLETANYNTENPSILIAAGFHGNEPAGVWASLWFAKNYHRMKLRQHINISFLPLVNPTGFSNNKRKNSFGNDPNRGFCHSEYPELSKEELSEEGHILLKNSDRILKCAKNGFLSLHEDPDETKFYVYTFEKTQEPDRLSKVLLDVENKFFKPYPDGEIAGVNGEPSGDIAHDGLILNEHDGSYEDYMFHRGVPMTSCTETPGKLDMSLRVKANVELIRAFAYLTIDVHNKSNKKYKRK